MIAPIDTETAATAFFEAYTNRTVARADGNDAVTVPVDVTIDGSDRLAGLFLVRKRDLKAGTIHQVGKMIVVARSSRTFYESPSEDETTVNLIDLLGKTIELAAEQIELLRSADL